MFLVVGLGNPGTKYRLNRHNIGYMVIDQLRDVCGGSEWQTQKKMAAEVAECEMSGKKVVLLKPQTFMNLSGEAVEKWLTYHRPNSNNLMVILVHDDVDIDAGKLKIQLGGGAAGHHGVESVYQHVKMDIVRLRMGIGRPKVVKNADGQSLGVGNFATAEEMKTQAQSAGDFCAYRSLKDWVLSDFTRREQATFLGIQVERGAAAAIDIIASGVQEAMNKFNG